MNSMLRMLRLPLLLVALAALSACGFHLRRSAALPESMKQVHLTVSGGGKLERSLSRALELAGSTVVDHGGTGIAELKVPTAAFSTQTLTVGGTARVTEYSVRYHVDFSLSDGQGNVVIPQRGIDMSRDFSYDALNTIGTAAQTEQLQNSLVDDMVQSILFRLEAAAKHPEVIQPATTPAPKAD
jgi:LPS-assembly lipoprotein